MLLTRNAAESGTLWGTERPSSAVRPKGVVIAYLFVQQPREGAAWLARYLRDSGCSFEDRHAASRWAAERYSCP
jgi:hypothetical protein